MGYSAPGRLRLLLLGYLPIQTPLRIVCDTRMVRAALSLYQMIFFDGYRTFSSGYFAALTTLSMIQRILFLYPLRFLVSEYTIVSGYALFA